jgi:hypothetical protein
MTITVAQLRTLLESGDVEACVQFFRDADEADRRAVAKLAEQWLAKLSKEAFLQTAPGTFERNPRLPAAEATALAACSLTVLKRFSWRALPEDELVVRVFADRRPAWLHEYAEFLIDQEPARWTAVRAMMRAGLCRKPTSDRYVLAMTHHFGGVGCSTDGDIVAHLTAEPDLLDDVWRLFEIEGGGEYSLATHDKYRKGDRHRWDQAFCELSKRGVLSRERLLDASLDALDRGFAQFRAGWFAAFHELMEPTATERLARADGYLRLLASPIPPTVSFALAAVESIDRRQPIPAEKLFAAIQPVMLSRAKATVKAALKLVDRAAARAPVHAPESARMAAGALVHESADVQSAVLAFIERHGLADDAQLVEAIAGVRDSVAASVRSRLAKWLAGVRKPETPVHARAAGRPSPRAETKTDLRSFERRAKSMSAEWVRLAGVDRALDALRRGEIDVVACEFDGTEFPRLAPERAIPPVATLDELIDDAAATLENAGDVDAMESVFDGVSRLCDERPDNFARLTGPLLKRTMKLLSRGGPPFTGGNPRADLIGVVLAWLRGDYGSPRPKYEAGMDQIDYEIDDDRVSYLAPHIKYLGGALSQRVRELADRVMRRQAAPLLSAPTHRGGWIDPVVLANRVRQTGGDAAGDFDKVLALLRLAPDRRADAISRLAGVRSDFAKWVRYACGGPGRPPESPVWLWSAATRARTPWCNDDRLAKAHADLGPDAGTAARPVAHVTRKTKQAHPRLVIRAEPAVPRRPDARMLSVMLWNKPTGHHGAEFETLGAVRALCRVWPLALESAFAWGAAQLADNLDWWEATWSSRAYLEPLLDPDVPLRPMATLLLVLGLAAKEPGEHGLATDAAVAAISDGRADGRKLGTAMATLLPTGLVLGTRWAKTLARVASTSSLHAAVVRAAIEGSLVGDPNQAPKDLHALVELLHELTVETGVAVGGSAREFLAAMRGSGKLAKTAKSLLAATAQSDPNRAVDIMKTVLESRLSRIERWAQSQ